MPQSSQNVLTHSPKTWLHTERLTVPWSWWLIAVVPIAIVGYELHLATNNKTWTVLGICGIALIAAAMLWAAGGKKVGVYEIRTGLDSDSAHNQKILWAAGAQLPIHAIGQAKIIPPSSKQAALGRLLDPAAFLAYRNWIKPLVLVVLNDPTDPTPYWLISTRKPEKIMKLIQPNGQ